MLHKLMDAIRQGLAAHREYERFMSMGMNHDRALRAALSISTVPTGRRITNSQTLSLLIALITPLMNPRHRAHGDGLA